MLALVLYYNKMKIIGIINLIGFIILATVGVIFSIKNWKNFVRIVGLQINRKTVIGFFTMLFISGLVMFSIFIINMNLGLLEIESLSNISILITSIPIEFINAAGEEFLIRILVFTGILYLFNNRLTALLLSSIIFCFLHNPESLITVLSYFLAGLMYGIAFLYLKTIWAPIGLHFGWNYFQGVVFGFPVSNEISDGYILIKIVGSKIWNGAEIGPEGSVIGVVGRCLIIMMTLVIAFRYYKNIESNQFLKIK